MPTRHRLHQISLTGRPWCACILTLVAVCVLTIGPVAAETGPAETFRVLPAEAVVPDAYFNDLFTRYSGGWTGGDGTYSVRLPDNRTLWMFGDSFVGEVGPDRSRPEHSRLINNCFVIQRGSDLVTLYGGTAEAPQALVAPPSGKGFYWPGDGTVADALLRVFFNRFRRTGKTPWQWQWLGTDVVDFSLPDLERVATSTVDTANGVMYGAALLEDGQNVYVYGTEDLRRIKHLHLARFPAGDPAQPWQFYTGSGWSCSAERSVRLLAGIANQFSVIEVGRRYLLITTDNRVPLNSAIVAYVALSPTGPWMPGVRIYTPPEARGQVVAYNALAHPQFTRDDQLLLSYNLNHLNDVEALYRNADLYRPRFIRVQLRQVMQCLGTEQVAPN